MDFDLCVSLAARGSARQVPSLRLTNVVAVNGSFPEPELFVRKLQLERRVRGGMWRREPVQEACRGGASPREQLRQTPIKNARLHKVFIVHSLDA